MMPVVRNVSPGSRLRSSTHTRSPDCAAAIAHAAPAKLAPTMMRSWSMRAVFARRARRTCGEGEAKTKKGAWAPFVRHCIDGSAAAVATATGATTAARTAGAGTARTRTAGTRACRTRTTRAARTRATGTRTAGACTTGTRAAGTTRTRAAGLVGVGIETAGIRVVGREVRRVAGVPVRTRATATTAGTARAARRAVAAIRAIAVGVERTRRAATGAAVAAARTAELLAATAARLAAVRFPGARAFGIAMTGRTGLDAFGHEPRAERGGIAAVVALLARAHALALLARTLRLERTGAGLRRGLAADGETAVRLLAAAAAAAIFAHMVEATQFASFVRGVVAADITRCTARATEVQRRLRRLALADHGHQRQRRGRAVFQAELRAKHGDLVRRQFLRLAAQQRLRQRHVAVTDALEARDLAALRFPQAADFAVAAFLQQHAEPVVGTVFAAADAFDFGEVRRAVVEQHAAVQAIDELVGDFLFAFRRAHAAHVLAFDFEGGMHHRVGQLAVGGEQQQAGGVDVEAADRDPARALQCGQRFEDGRAAFGIFAGGDFAFGLVVDQHARGFGQRAGDERASVDFDLVAAGHAHADLRGVAVDAHQAVGDALFQRAARAEAGLREHLVQALLDAGGVGGLLFGGAALEGQLAAFLIAHWVCSDEAVSASSSSVMDAVSSSSASSGECAGSCAPASGSSSIVSSTATSCMPSMELSSSMGMSPTGSPVAGSGSNWNCGSSSPMSFSSDSGGSSSRRLSPK